MAKVELKFGELGGGTKCNIDTFSVSAGEQKSIPVGFQPKQLSLYKITSSSSDYGVVCVYDENITPSSYWRTWNFSSSGTLNLVRTSMPSSNPLMSIDANGFTVKISQGATDLVGTYTYIAVG